MPPAPPRFSTIVCCPRNSAACSCTMRIIVSGRPPAAYGTTSLIARFGNPCASARRETRGSETSSANSRASVLLKGSPVAAKYTAAHEETPPHARLLGLRSHARADGRQRAARRHRPRVPQPAGGGNLLPPDEVPGVRLLGNVALRLYGVARPEEPAFHRHPGVSFALLSPLVHLRLATERRASPRRPERQAHRRAGVPDDRRGVDPRHPFG